MTQRPVLDRPELTAFTLDRNFWRARRIFLTGHTGFKGAWLSLWLELLGAEVTGYALEPVGPCNLWGALTEGGRRLVARSVIADIRDRENLAAEMERARPQMVIHMAAQPLVLDSYADPVGTYGINVLGTAHVLDACRRMSGLECILVVTSDKVYENRGEGRSFEEGDRLGGRDPYSSSKACAELVTASFRDSFLAEGPALASARSGNVIGGGDWSQDRLIPDCIRALEHGTPVRLRHPGAVRPWQHVLEPLAGYLQLAQALVAAPDRAPKAVNFGPDPRSFRRVSEVVEIFSAHCGGPGWVSADAPHPEEAHTLTLSSRLAESFLGWRPRLDMTVALAWTAGWYRAHASGTDMRAFSEDQIGSYVELMGEPS